ncbi:MAG: phage integrase N-terminal SAM-like domain-containing protein [Actinobacteria bacterium]|nr:phage integrase N-terminal SAM-like domain-containing protein [Actinomycetota bacterium]
MALQEDNWRTYVASSGSDGIVGGRLAAEPRQGSGAPPRTAGTAHGLNYVLTGWEWHLRAADRSPKTMHSYVQIVRRFTQEGNDPLTVTKVDVGAHLLDLRADCQASTVGLAYQVLHQFFRWLVAEGDRKDNPIERLPRPTVTPSPLPVLSDRDIRALLTTCNDTNPSLTDETQPF